jgi:hypothetical protein
LRLLSLFVRIACTGKDSQLARRNCSRMPGQNTTRSEVAHLPAERARRFSMVCADATACGG